MLIKTLENLLDVCDESVHIRVMDMDDETVALYDGCNSIPLELNNAPVRTFKVYTDEVTVIIGGAI